MDALDAALGELRAGQQPEHATAAVPPQPVTAVTAAQAAAELADAGDVTLQPRPGPG